MSTIKERLLEYLDNKGISIVKAEKDLGWSKGSLWKTSSISSDRLGEFLLQYPDLSIEWVITGKGDMNSKGYASPTSQIIDHGVQRRFQIFMEKEFSNNVESLSKASGISQEKIGSLIKGLFPDYSDVINMSNAGVDLEWLLTGKGNMSKQQTEIVSSMASQKTRPRIPLTAVAGSLSEASNGVTMEDCEQLPVIHQFPSYDFTMLIKGDSMSPKYESGDEVACRKIDQNRYIQWGKVHVLDTTQGIIIKRVYEDGDNKIRCVSYNKEYADFSIPKEDIYSMSLVVGVLSITEM